MAGDGVPVSWAGRNTKFQGRILVMEQTRSMVDYYGKRAPEYDRIYEKPERQGDLATLKEIVRETFRGEDVLEIACGTGYWTETLTEVSRSVTAVDLNESVLEIARGRRGAERVRFEKADVYGLPELPESSACLCAFWWSHMPKNRIAEFLAGLHQRLKRGATVLIMDNCYVEGNSTPTSRRDSEGNTYQTRKLDDGSTHEVLKNFPTEEELQQAVAGMAEGAAFRALHYYWTFTYRVKV
jgi:SAM-dependent methyltransferase